MWVGGGETAKNTLDKTMMLQVTFTSCLITLLQALPAGDVNLEQLVTQA